MGRVCDDGRGVHSGGGSRHRCGGDERSRSADAAASDCKRFILIGLCEPVDNSPKTLAGFDEWLVNQHVEDVSQTSGFVRSRVYKLRGPHLKEATYTQYISFYEVDAPSWEHAEQVLNDWQQNPDAWPGRANHMATGKRVGNVMKCPSSGWYEMLNTHSGPAKAATGGIRAPPWKQGEERETGPTHRPPGDTLTRTFDAGGADDAGGHR